MKNLILIIGGIILLFNILLNFIISAYHPFNVFLGCFSIIITSLLLYFLQRIQLRDGFYISLSCLFTLMGLITFFLSIISPERIENNWSLIGIILILTIEIIIMLMTNFISKKIK